MSAGICGKRLGFEEIFGSQSSYSVKRSRCSAYGSPTRSPELGSGSDDKVLTLLQMFPAVDPELVKTALRENNNRIDAAIESLQGSPFHHAVDRNDVPSSSASTCTQQMGKEEAQEVKPSIHFDNPIDGSKWVDLFVHEMMTAADLDDARRRAASILEAFEKTIASQSRDVSKEKEMENASLRDHLQGLVNDNQILKRAVAIQHERNLEQEEKAKEVHNLKLVLNQYQEQVRSLELNNYALKLHLQRAQQQPSSFPGHFPPDIC
ncbi:unnamed protein product [Linum tenue]|uniref:CUE domain-containing protein n=1 Tax=Linum tenue TaxID=586396 RepID=A0AAV0PP21_9ROSI|nr:unnamed protein product [Linum tenue]